MTARQNAALGVLGELADPGPARGWPAPPRRRGGAAARTGPGWSPRTAPPGTDAVHHVVGIALQQRHHRADVERRLLLGRGQDLGQRAPPQLARDAARPRHRRGSARRRRRGGSAATAPGRTAPGASARAGKPTGGSPRGRRRAPVPTWRRSGRRAPAGAGPRTAGTRLQIRLPNTASAPASWAALTRAATRSPRVTGGGRGPAASSSMVTAMWTFASTHVGRSIRAASASAPARLEAAHLLDRGHGRRGSDPQLAHDRLDLAGRQPRTGRNDAASDRDRGGHVEERQVGHGAHSREPLMNAVLGEDGRAR